MPAAPKRPLNILHVLRAPVGGLFRHVMDLAACQAARGHRVGIVADSSTGGVRADAAFAALAPQLALGLLRRPMSRHIDFTDKAAVAAISRRARESHADVVHGHGAKGGAYARLAAHDALRVYTPHGGSLHYGWLSPVGLFYLASERFLKRRTDLILFESQYGRETFRAKIGQPSSLVRVVHNGVTPDDFTPIEPALNATDLVFVGELRILKGVDVLIAAVALMRDGGRAVTATVVGDGPDRATFEARVQALGLSEAVRFTGALPARTAFALGRLMVVPSRAESLPYVVLEAAAAGVPMVATRVGGIPEILGPDAGRLIPPGDARALATALNASLADRTDAHAAAARLRDRVRAHFSADVMTDAVLAAYGEAMTTRRKP
jgi:glycosyltransferase involved in cell wall biosynthesis